MRFILITVLMALNHAAAADWVALPGLPPNSGIYFDSAALNLGKDGDTVTMWDLHDLEQPERVGNISHQSLKAQHEYDCKQGRTRMLQLSLHAGRMGSGNVVYSGNDLPAPWRNVRGGLAEFRWKHACGRPLPSPPNPLAGVTLGGGDGTSIEQAIIINGAPNSFTGVGAEYAWLAQRFPGYKRRGQSVLKPGGKIYDRIEIITADGQSLTVYFDITAFYGQR